MAETIAVAVAAADMVTVVPENDTAPETAPEFATDKVMVVPAMLTTVAPVPIPVPITN